MIHEFKFDQRAQARHLPKEASFEIKGRGAVLVENYSEKGYGLLLEKPVVVNETLTFKLDQSLIPFKVVWMQHSLNYIGYYHVGCCRLED